MKSAFSFVALLLLSSLVWTQNINSPSNITANSLSVPNATTYSSGTVVNQFNGGQSLAGTDLSIWNNSPFRIAGHLSKSSQDNTGNGSSDEFNLDVESYADNTGSTITNCVETPSNVVTLTTSAHQASANLSMTMYGLTHCTWLNYQVIHVSSVTTSPSYTIVFTDPTSHGSSTSHSDTGQIGPSAFKGPIFAVAYSNDGFWDAPEAYTYYTHVVTGNRHAYAEGMVGVVDTQCVNNPCTINSGNGDGTLIGVESDVDNNGTDVNGSNDLGGCATFGTNCKINLYLGTGGVYPNSWAILGSNGGPGYHNGINLQGVKATGEALYIPNNTYIDSRKADNSQDLIIMHLDTGNTLELGAGYPGVSTVAVIPPMSVAHGGSANHLICWKSDGKTLGYCSNDPGSGNGTCTCN